jgi:hypothetical protein
VLVMTVQGRKGAAQAPGSSSLLFREIVLAQMPDKPELAGLRARHVIFELEGQTMAAPSR